MTYPRRLRLDQLEAIAPILEQLASLRPGQTLHVVENAEVLPRLRYLLYAYFASQGASNSFRLKVLSATEMILQFRSVPTPRVSVEGLAGLSDAVLNFVQTELLEVEDEFEARRRVGAAVETSLLDPTDIVPALAEWRRWIGKEEEK